MLRVLLKSVLAKPLSPAEADALLAGLPGRMRRARERGGARALARLARATRRRLAARPWHLLRAATAFFAAEAFAATLECLAGEFRDAQLALETEWLRARALQQLRRFGEAQALLRAALGRTPAEGEHPEMRAHLVFELGMCLLRCNRFDEAEALLRQAAALRPADGAADRSVVWFPRLMRSAPPLPRQPPPEFVYYFVDLGDAAGYLEMIAASARSARASAPGARCVLLTDRATEVPAALGMDAVERFDLDPAELVHERLRVLADFLARADAAVGRVLLDPDTLVARDLRGVLGGGYDLGFTVRSDFTTACLDPEPFNVGVITVPGGGARAAGRFFARCVEWFARIEAREEVRAIYPAGLRRWRGDQLLPAALVGWADYAEHVLSGRTNRLEVDGCRVAFLDSSRFNYHGEDDNAPGVYVRHYKGGRKNAMGEARDAARPQAAAAAPG